MGRKALEMAGRRKRPHACRCIPRAGGISRGRGAQTKARPGSPAQAGPLPCLFVLPPLGAHPAVRAVRREVRRLIDEPDALPFLAGVAEVFRDVQEFVRALDRVCRLDVEQASGVAESQRAQNRRQSQPPHAPPPCGPARFRACPPVQPCGSARTMPRSGEGSPAAQALSSGNHRRSGRKT